MEFAEVVRRRRMVRAYQPDPVPTAVLERVLDTARRGPSAGFTQGQSFVVVTREPARQRIAELCREPAFVAAGERPWLSAAPVHVVVCTSEAAYRQRYAETDKTASRGPSGWAAPFWWVDAGAALSLLLLAAVDEGLGAGFLDPPDRDGLRTLLAIPGDVEIAGLATLGYPAASDAARGSPVRRARRDRDEVIRWEAWSG